MKDELKGEICLLFSSVVLALVSILVKNVSGHFSGFFIAGARFGVGIVLGFVILKITKVSFKVTGKKNWFLRGLFGSAAMILYFVNIEHTGPARATLLFNTFPLFVALFGYLFFKEPISRWNILSIIICLTGVLFVFYDGSSYATKWDIMGLVSGMLSGITVHYIKKSSHQNHPLIVYLAACFVGVTMLLAAKNEFVKLDSISLLYLSLIGTITLFGQVAMTYGYRHMSATKGSVISYMGIPLTVLFSYLFVNEEFKFKFFIGIILIVCGLLINRKKDIASLS